MRKSTTVATTCETDQNKVGRVSGRERGEPNEITFSSVWQHIDPGLEGSVQTGWWRSWDWSVVTASTRSLTSPVPTLPPCVPPGPPHNQSCREVRGQFNHLVFCVERAFFSLPPKRHGGFWSALLLIFSSSPVPRSSSGWSWLWGGSICFYSKLEPCSCCLRV